MLNKKQKESLAKLLYDVIKLVVGGVGISGIMQKDVSLCRIILEVFGAVVVCSALLGLAIKLEKDNQNTRGRGRGS